MMQKKMQIDGVNYSCTIADGNHRDENKGAIIILSTISAILGVVIVLIFVQLIINKIRDRQRK